VKFRFIAKNADQYEVTFMCRELGVSKSGYYASRSRGTSKRRREDLELVPHIHAEFEKHPRGCGSRMVAGALRAQGRSVGRRRVARLMSEEKLRPRLKRRFICKTGWRSKEAVAENVLDREFEAGEVNKAWAADITQVWTKRGWAYLAVVLDLGSRRVVGWQVGTSMDEGLVLAALRTAIAQRRPPPGLVHHSDQGRQYLSSSYQQLLVDHGMVCSVSRRGNCWDNACVESFFSTLKRELPNERPLDDAHQLERAVFAYVDAYYNTRRPHSTLGYRTPNEYEQLQAAT
jgi:transposase InsO family protein